jgi:hypothetical protein
MRAGWPDQVGPQAPAVADTFTIGIGKKQLSALTNAARPVVGVFASTAQISQRKPSSFALP